MSKSNAIRTMFSRSSTPTKVVVKDQSTGNVRPAQSETMSEIERLRAENAALRAKQNGSPKAKPAVTVNVRFNSEIQCVEITGPFKPKYISKTYWKLIKDNAEVIDGFLA